VSLFSFPIPGFVSAPPDFPAPVFVLPPRYAFLATCFPTSTLYPGTSLASQEFPRTSSLPPGVVLRRLKISVPTQDFIRAGRLLPPNPAGVFSRMTDLLFLFILPSLSPASNFCAS
jgi:hypothetical protein